MTELLAPAGYRRPFGDAAPWNRPVAGLPRHPRSADYAAKVWAPPGGTAGNINLTFDTFTYPVYDAAAARRPYTVRLAAGASGNLDGQPVPWDPEWLGSSGSDGQAIVLDAAAGREWDLWRVRLAGAALKADNGSLVPGSYWTRTTGWGPSRGCGIPYLAMLVRPAEVAAGAVRHALSMPLLGVDKRAFVAPATRTDGGEPGFGVVDGVPEGTRLALDVSDQDLQAWALAVPARLGPAARRSALTIGRALRDYGWFVTDHAGSAHLQFEDRLTAGPAWDALGLADVELAGKRYPRDLLDGLVTRERIYALAAPPYPGQAA